jgi:hypothetical protein
LILLAAVGLAIAVAVGRMYARQPYAHLIAPTTVTCLRLAVSTEQNHWIEISSTPAAERGEP